MLSEFWALDPSPIWMISPNAALVSREIEIPDVPVVRAGGGPQRGVAVRRAQPGEQRGVRGLDANPPPAVGTSDVDVRSVIHASPDFTGSTKLPTNSAFACEHHRVSGPRAVQRGLKIASCCYLDCRRLDGGNAAQHRRREGETHLHRSVDIDAPAV